MVTASSRNQVLTVDEKLENAKIFKEKGNEFFKSRNYKSAIGKYHRGLLYIRGVEEHFRTVHPTPTVENKLTEKQTKIKNELKANIYNNLSASLLNQDDGNFQKVRQYCDEVMKIEPNNGKAMYRKGLSYYHENNFDDALKCFVKVKELLFSDPGIDKYIALCKRHLEEFSNKEKERYLGMFER